MRSYSVGAKKRDPKVIGGKPIALSLEPLKIRRTEDVFRSCGHNIKNREWGECHMGWKSHTKLLTSREKEEGGFWNFSTFFRGLNRLQRCRHHQLPDTVIPAWASQWCGGLGFMIARLSTVVILQLWLAREEKTRTSVKMLAGEHRSLRGHRGWQPHSKHDAGNGFLPRKEARKGRRHGHAKFEKWKLCSLFYSELLHLYAICDKCTKTSPLCEW